MSEDVPMGSGSLSALAAQGLVCYWSTAGLLASLWDAESTVLGLCFRALRLLEIQGSRLTRQVSLLLLWFCTLGFIGILAEVRVVRAHNNELQCFV